MRLFLPRALAALPQPSIPANLIESHQRSGTPDELLWEEIK
jgi:hypothetical protein